MVIVNARFLTQKITGVQRFAVEIALRLKILDPTIKFIAPYNINNIELAKKLDVEIIGTKTGYYWEQIELLAFLKKNGNPLLLNMGNNAPVFYKNNAVVIHDICILKHPTWYSKLFYIAYRIMLPLLVKKSKFLFTVSEFCKTEIQTHFNTERQIDIIYNAIDDKYITQNTNGDQEVEYTNYILAVSSRSPRKNFDRIIEAFSLLKGDLKLIIVGGTYASFPTTKFEIPEDKKSQIIFTGYISDQRLNNLYKRSIGFIYPSLYEGFGIPPLEAMNMDCPVIVSDNTCFREVCKDAAVYVNPYDINQLKDAMVQLQTNHDLRQKLITNGKIVKNLYSWDTSALKLYKILNS